MWHSIWGSLLAFRVTSYRSQLHRIASAGTWPQHAAELPPLPHSPCSCFPCSLELALSIQFSSPCHFDVRCCCLLRTFSGPWSHMPKESLAFPFLYVPTMPNKEPHWLNFPGVFLHLKGEMKSWSFFVRMVLHCSLNVANIQNYL